MVVRRACVAVQTFDRADQLRVGTIDWPTTIERSVAPDAELYYVGRPVALKIG